jgi:Trypsin-co-occurring domain 1
MRQCIGQLEVNLWSLMMRFGQLGPVVKGIVSHVRTDADWPDEVEVEFAVKISADSTVIIARVGGEANFRIAKLTADTRVWLDQDML